MKRSALLLVIPLLVLAGCSRQAPAPEPVRAVRTITVGNGSAALTHEFAAEIRPRVESRLAFRVPGKMVERRVELGQRVKAGEVLARLDPQDLKLAQDAARAAVQAAQVNATLAAADLKRFRELREQNFISGAELERRETTFKSAEAALEQARAQAAVQGNQAGYSALVATASGVVTGIDAEVGAVLAAGAPVVRLAHDGPRDAVFAVPEDMVSALRPLLGRAGALQVRLWGTNQTFAATVRELAAAADPVTRTFLVKADVGSAPVQLGQTATAALPPAQSAGIKLPLAALMQVQGKTQVWLVDKDKMTVSPAPVQVAGADGNEAVIASGLKPGQIVVTAGVHVLTPGQPVKFWQAPAQPAAQR